MKPEETINIIDQQQKEAERLGITLEQEPDEVDQEVNKPQDDSKESQEEDPEKKIEQEESESKKQDEDKSEDDDAGKKPEVKNPSKGSLQQEAFKQREAKRLQVIVDDQMNKALMPVMEMLRELKAAKSPEEKTNVVENIDDELAKLAEAENIPLEQFKKIAGLLTKQVQESISPQLKKIDEIQPIIELRTQQEYDQQIQDDFSKEWESQGETILVEQYKDATPKQLKEARALLASLAISADYGDTRGNKEGVQEHTAYPLDYIIYKEADRFDTILRNPKKKTFENSGSISDEDNTEDNTLENAFQDREITSAREAIDLNNKINRVMGKDRTVVRRQGVDVDITG